jgi:formylglycine-generating enzyme required for sulfatase activity
VADEEGIGGGENQGGAEVPIADGCGVERGGGLGQGKGDTPAEKQTGIKGVYPWGKEWPPPAGAGNYADTAFKAKTGRDLPGIDGYTDGFVYTAPVGSFAANKLGLHDMGGNVWEWCEDKYSPTISDRVTRGASWDLYNSAYLLSSYRNYGTPDYRGSAIGFRCVLVGGSGG